MIDKAIPRLRFKGFCDEWSLQQLGTISYVTKLAGFEFTKYVNYSNKGHIVALRGVNIINNSINLNDVRFIDNSDFSKLSRSKLYKGDIVFTYVGTLGKNALINYNNKYYLAPNVALIRLNKDISPYFIHQLISMGDYYHKCIYPFVNTSSQPALSMQSIRKFPIRLPSLLEQRKIGIFFAILDRLIQLQQKKVSLLKRLKKAYLQKLFPRKNEATPRMRFKGFKNKWKLINITHIANIVGGGTPSTSNKSYWDGDINWYSPDEISHNESPYVYKSKRKITDKGLNHSSAHLHPANTTILFTTRATIGDMAILKEPASTNQGFQSLELKQHISPYFIYSYKSIIKHKALRLSHGSTFKEVSKSDLKELNLLMPSYKEQSELGQFFKQFDINIICQRNYYSILYRLKKAYLQKMFC